MTPDGLPGLLASAGDESARCRLLRDTMTPSRVRWLSGRGGQNPQSEAGR